VNSLLDELKEAPEAECAESVTAPPAREFYTRTDLSGTDLRLAAARPVCDARRGSESRLPT